jgi:N-glycosylase/DNA lyase
VGKAREVSPAAAPAAGWSDWQPLAGIPPLGADVLAEIVDGGQAFRWHHQPDGSWLGVWANHIARLRLDRHERLEWSAPESLAPAMPAAVAGYFAADRDFAALADTLPWRSDPHLARCLVSFDGLRILRQPFGETLLGFLCSATKQIVQIKQMLALLAERHGQPILPAPTRNDLNPEMARLHRLPTWTELATVPEPDLRRCLLGFRARYIAEVARFLAAHPGWLEDTEALPYAAAHERLQSLAGVGAKIADCVLLFGAGRLEAFPVDVWILKTMARRYELDGWAPRELAQFGRVHFGPLAGLAQQFLFAWERREAKAGNQIVNTGNRKAWRR